MVQSHDREHVQLEDHASVKKMTQSLVESKIAVSRTNSANLHIKFVSATWSRWSPWSLCSVTCGNGSMERTRSCPIPGVCWGENYQTKNCQEQKCRTLHFTDFQHPVYLMHHKSLVMIYGESFML